jgi:hypothetical protein
MTNERVATIAISISAALLATTAVAFTLSGNTPQDPRRGDLPVVTVVPAAAAVPTLSVSVPSLTASPGAVAGQPVASGPSAPPQTRSAAAPSSSETAGTGAASTTAATAAGSSAASGTRKSHDPDHEVVKPRIHETDEHAPPVSVGHPGANLTHD